MAYWKTQAWVTSVVNEESFSGALVLAESLRRSKTTRRIVVITSHNVSLEKRLILRKVFDVAFLMDEMYVVGKIGQGDLGEAQAKAYVFALTLFEKCVFISADSMILENSDSLFESTLNFRSRIDPVDGSIDMSLFVLQPEREFWEQIWNSVNLDGNRMSSTHLGMWLKNQGAVFKMGLLPDRIIVDLCLSSGKLKTDRTHAPIIRFVDGQNAKLNLLEKVKVMRGLELGLPEKIISNEWLEMFATVTGAMSNKRPFDSIPLPLCMDDGNYRNEPIAIVGMSCRYPGANNLKEFWNMLYGGEEGIREPPAFRWTKEHTLRVTQQDRKSAAGFLATTVDEFDARFFGVSPKEAAYMDPQTRLLHEVLWESLEDAGINPLSLYGTHAGIFTGSWMNDYKDIVTHSTEKDFFRTYMGNSIGAAAARLSFLLGLTGPSIATESGCSSAIVAVDLAVKSLRASETNLALAGGVNLLLHPFNSGMMEYVISPDGRCKTFDAKANGFGRAEGCGVLVLKRLGDALRDRDNIWALIRGSAVSQEGLSRSLGTPTVHCESLAMSLALEDANVSPERVSFVETHGTGTQVGDPMEVSAIAKAYHSRHRKHPLVIGSVKTNVGHTESCSGITGIMKAVLAMHHEMIPKHRNLETLNPEIFLDSIPAIIPTENLAWPKAVGQPRICGVSSFGITGTDGHVILEEAPTNLLPKFTLGMERQTHLMTISAKSSEALQELLKEYENRFNEKNAEEFCNIAYTANVGRAAFSHRAFIVSKNCADAGGILKDKKYLQGEPKDGHQPQISFLFTGQGSQYPGMAKTLYETSPIFRIHFDECQRELRTKYGVDIKKVLWESEAGSKELSRTIYSQTSIFCVEYCLLKLWQSWGIQPDFVLGHSLGEFCAAVAAGILDFQDALKLVAERSRLIDNLPRGSMLVVKASKPEVEKLMQAGKTDLDFAAVNNPEQTVVAGDTKTVEEFLTYLTSQNVKAIILEATHAFHSRHMDPMLEQYRKVAQTIKFKRGNSNIQYVSGMEGRVIDDASEMGANYWVRHTRDKVSFVDACAALKECGCQDFLEVGPQPVLSSFVMMNNDGVSLNCLPSLRRGQQDWDTILTSLGKLYLLGYAIDWKAYDEPYIRKKVSLPFHPFHRKPFWVECTQDNAAIIHPLVGQPMKNASSLNIFQNDLTLKNVPYLKDHCIGSRVVFPGAGYTEMCLSAAYCVASGLKETFEQPTRPMRLENMRIEAPLELKEGKSCRVQAIVNLPDKTEQQEGISQGFRVKVFHQNTNNSEEHGKWVLHASSTFIPMASTKECMKSWNPTHIQEIMKGNPNSPEPFYKKVDEQGLKFGETFRMIRRYWTKKQPDCKEDTDEVVTEIALPSDWNKYLLHPLIIDAGFQTGILTRFNYESPKLKVPVRIGEMTLFSGVNAKAEDESLYMHVRTENGIRQLFFCSTDWNPICFVNDVEMVDTNVRAIESVLEQQSSAVPDAWEEIWKVIPSPFNSSLEKPVDLESLDLAHVYERDADGEKKYHETRRLLYLYILNTLQTLGWTPEVGDITTVDQLCIHLGIKSQFQNLVRFYLTQIQHSGKCLQRQENEWRVVTPLPSPESIQQELEQATASLDRSVVVNLIYEHLAQNLAEILQGKVNPLSLLFPQEEDKQQYSADIFYQKHPARPLVSCAVAHAGKAILEQSVRLNGRDGGKVYRVLEVGAGTGSISAIILPLLRNTWDTRFEYYYTDISHSFFIKAEKKFEEYKENLKFAVFNLEESPLSQGIPLEYFDMVCCTDVLHATRNLEETLIHLRQTLKPNGVLLFTETIIPARDITYVFGLLEGYWRMEDKERRPDHCCVSEKVWAEVLRKTGFGRVETKNMYMDQFACITAVADAGCQGSSLVSPTRLQASRPEWLVFTDVADLERISGPVTQMLHASGFKATVVVREEEGTCSCPDSVGVSRVCAEDEQEIRKLLSASCALHGLIFGWGLRKREKDQRKLALPLLHVAKAMVSMTSPPQLFVLTQGVHPVQEDVLTENPSAATLLGMTKSLRNESTSIFARTVDLEAGASPPQLVAQVLYELAMSKTPREVHRLQVAYRGGLRYEPRLVKAALPKAGEALKLPPSTDRFYLKLPETRVIQDLEFEPDNELQLKGNEVEVKVKTFALNFRDILTILKPIADFEKFNTVGLDFAGVVVRAGPDAEWKVGDRVFGANFQDGPLPSHLAIEHDALLRIPEDMTFSEAATLPAVFLTTFHCLLTLARMKKGDTVLIHTASGGVGLAAIQLAKHVGATIVATAGNPRKKAYLRGLGIEHVFHSRDTSFETDILRVTQGRGVNIVLNSITGPGVKEATLRATARNGRFVEMSKLNVWTTEEVKILRPDVDYHLIDLTQLDKPTFQGLFQQIQKYLTAQLLKPLPHVRFDALHLRQALHYLQKAKHIGKVVVTMPEVTREAGKYKTQVPLFNGESSYLITGGLGGIGFEVCKWMLGLGATDIVLMGRSPPQPGIAEQIRKLNENGAHVRIRLGDVGSMTQCDNIIGEINQSMKPLRGVMHCAGVLRDNLYSTQTWPAFEETYTPKVQGTWNLHNLTKPCPLEHFVVYSSITALVGTPAQPNHASANCFEDAFIHYRHSLGLPGTTINWGQWAQVGCAKEVNITGLLPVSVQRMLNGLEIALKSQKRQVSFSEFESFEKFLLLCPSLRRYIDERVWKQYSGASTAVQTNVNTDEFWQKMDSATTQPEKVSVLSGYLKAILRAALRLEADEPLGDDANIQELGVDSLMMLELKNSIQTLLGSRLTITTNMLKNCNTIRLLSNAVVSKLMDDCDGEAEEIPEEPLPAGELLPLLRKDAILDEAVKPEPNAIPAVKASEIKTVLVTGATGQVAPYLIAQLTQEHACVERIWCLVSGENEILAKERLKAALTDALVDYSKIEAVTGNVALGNLGVSPEKYDQLVLTVDAVIHCAAKTHPTEHFRPANSKLSDIRSVTVGGTVNVLKFACSGKVKRIFFPSVLLCGGIGENTDHRLADSWPESSTLDTIVSNKFPGLQTSKWICEMLLRQANTRGVPCKIFRLPWAAGDSQTGRVDPLKNLYILRYLSFLKMGAMPAMPIPANVLPIDILAELSLRIFMTDETPNEIFNLAHPRPQVEQEFVTVAKEMFGKNLQVLEQSELEEKLQSQENSSSDNSELQNLYKNQKLLSKHFAEAAEFVTGYANAPDTFFKNEKILKYITNYGANFPTSMDVVRQDLKYLKEKGLLEKFGI